MRFLPITINSEDYAGDHIPADRRQKPNDLTVPISQKIYLDPSGEYVIYLHTGTFWNCVNNITAKKANNTIRIFNSFEWFNIVIPDGAYNIVDINEFLMKYFLSINELDTDAEGNVISPVSFEGNAPTGKVYVYLKLGWKWDTSVSLFRNVLGFNSKTIVATDKSNQYTLSDNEAQIEQGVEALSIHCNLVSNSIYNGKFSDVLYHTAIEVPTASQQVIKPFNLIKCDLEQRDFSEIKLRITDQSNNEIEMSQAVTYQIIIERIS